jgi:hypothetical protein
MSATWRKERRQLKRMRLWKPPHTGLSHDADVSFCLFSLMSSCLSWRSWCAAVLTVQTWRWKRYEKENIMAQSRYYPSIWLEWLTKPAELSGSVCPCRDLNKAPPEYDSRTSRLCKSARFHLFRRWYTLINFLYDNIAEPKDIYRCYMHYHSRHLCIHLKNCG